MKMVKTVIPLIILLNSIICFSQESDSKPKLLKDFHFHPSFGLSYQNQLVGEAGLLYAKESHGSCGGGFMRNFIGIKVASEFNFDVNHFYIAPKIAYEVNLPLISGRLSIIDYTNFFYHDLKITPEIGITYGGFINLHYGYNISLTEKTNNRIPFVGTYRVTLTINLWAFKYE